MSSFAHLTASPIADSIYYADLFLIQEKGWLIGGYGKSHAGLKASNYARHCDAARDSVALVRQGAALYGRHDAGAVHRNPDQAEPLHKIDVIAYCLGSEETAKVFPRRARTFLECPAKLMGLLLSDDPMPRFFGSPVPGKVQVQCTRSVFSSFFSEQQPAAMRDPSRRVDTFLELTEGIRDLKFLIVPFMPTVEEKAALYTSFFP